MLNLFKIITLYYSCSKWNIITIILISIRFINIFTTNNKTEALTETLGRIVGYLTLIFKKPLLK